MIKRWLSIIFVSSLLWLLSGCLVEIGPTGEGAGISLTVQCMEPAIQTKTLGPEQKDGEEKYNENLIKSVDFLFYPGTETDGTLDPDADAVYHIRKTLNEPAQNSRRFDLVLTRTIIKQIFTTDIANDPRKNKATVYVLVNYFPDSSDPSYNWVNDASLAGSSLNTLSQKLITTDFPSVETNYAQPYFLMEKKEELIFDEDSKISVDKVVNVKRLASKLTVAIRVESSIVLHHQNSTTNPPETWTPVLHTARVYLVDGTSTVLLNGNPVPEEQRSYITYKEDREKHDRRRPFVQNDLAPTPTPTVGMSPIDGYADFYETYPMYTYPMSWVTNVVHVDGQYHEPYLKLELDWTRQQDEHYTYDRRKYYYKVFLPFNTFERNNWYSMFIDVGILGSETDEGKAILEPSCYLLDWQDKSHPVDRPAVISKARYLYVEKQDWVLNNVDNLSIPFQSSHDVVIVPGSIQARRPYYGEDKSLGYKSSLFASVVKEGNQYFLEYGNLAGDTYNPEKWFPTSTAASILFNHPLNNDFEETAFDYSPYTIEFDIVHKDLLPYPSSFTYAQYCKHITITQYPAIYIEAIRNSDTRIKKIGSVYGYESSSAPWGDEPWGYVYVNGGRFLRKYKNAGDGEPFFKLADANSKREYQWQTVWYTGGSQDMFDIHVTVLPSGSKYDYVIGDPRSDDIDNLDDAERYPGLYIFEVGGNNPENDKAILEINHSPVISDYSRREGFRSATALYGTSPRTLTWYYPTEKTPRTQNMLAPSFRFASKFGGTEYGGSEFSDITKEYAEYRCAAYQEDGFPAGRWRLPTKAEIRFIAQLSAKKAFERLFSNSTYWSAHGAITVNGDAGTVSNSSAEKALLRCVYDSWYWDVVDNNNSYPLRHDPRDQFVWGDKER